MKKWLQKSCRSRRKQAALNGSDTKEQTNIPCSSLYPTSKPEQQIKLQYHLHTRPIQALIRSLSTSELTNVAPKSPHPAYPIPYQDFKIDQLWRKSQKFHCTEESPKDETSLQPKIHKNDIKTRNIYIYIFFFFFFFFFFKSKWYLKNTSLSYKTCIIKVGHPLQLTRAQF